MQQGDDDAAGRLLERHRSRLRQMVRARMDPRVMGRLDPSDVIQEAMAVAIRALPEYAAAPPIPFYPWLRRLAWDKLQHAHERHIDAQKRSVRREATNWELPDDSVCLLANVVAPGIATPSAAVMRRETCQRVRGALQLLDPAERELLCQRYLEHMTINEMAAVAEVTEATMRMRHLRAIRRLKRFLDEGEDT